jgi:hypothetical protein
MVAGVTPVAVADAAAVIAAVAPAEVDGKPHAQDGLAALDGWVEETPGEEVTLGEEVAPAPPHAATATSNVPVTTRRPIRDTACLLAAIPDSFGDAGPGTQRADP